MQNNNTHHVLNRVTGRIVYSTDSLSDAETKAVDYARNGGSPHAVLLVIASTEEKRIVEITRIPLDNLTL